MPDHIDLEPGDGQFTIQLRYRTKESFGNITQKGQATTRGGQWKIQSPQGIPSCLFQGADGQVATGAKTALNDDQWHDLTCVLTATGVTMYVDGEQRNRKNGVTGRIDNDIPLTIGGKINCDQLQITCDYFSGQIDYLRLSKASNLAPSASFSSACSVLTCGFDPGASADPDGSLTRYLWTFGDGTTSTDPLARHAYAAPGTYTVRLTVTDNQAVTATTTRTVVVDGRGPVSPVRSTGSSAAAGSSKTATVAVPATAEVGDRLVLLLDHNTISRTVGAPTGVGAFTSLGAVTAESMASYGWSTTVRAGDAGRTITVPLSGTAKYTLTAATYAGVAPGALPAAYAVDLSEKAERRTPVLTVPEGGWALSSWADRSGTTTAWTPDASVTTRRAVCGADGGRICSAVADTGAALPPGPYGDVPATTTVVSDEAVMWTVVLPPDPDADVERPPLADVAVTCTYLDCTVDGSGSTDPEGGELAYAWDLGDGTTASTAVVPHSYATAGTYEVALTVTDAAGLTDTVRRTLQVKDVPVQRPVAHVGSAAAVGTTSRPSVVVPAGVVEGDRLVLVLSHNNLTRTVAAPTGVTGWTQVASRTAGTMGTVVWTKVAAAGDAGRTVVAPLSGGAKSTLTVGAWSGGLVTPGLEVTSAADTVKRTVRTTPAVTVPDGAWVASYWADKSGTTSSWTSSGATSRAAACGTLAGHVCSLLADSAGPLAAGAAGGVGAATDVASKEATTWTFVLLP